MVFAPHPQHRRVVFVLIDGARHDVLRALLAQGDLPNLARWVIEPGGMTVGTTVFPSTTGVAYIPFLFGRYPGTADVPGIRWLDRGAAARGSGLRSQWRAARSYCGAQASWINRDITCGPSIFELVPQSLAICTPIVRGLRRGAHLMPARRALLGIAAHYFGTYGALDRAVADAWVAAAAGGCRPIWSSSSWGCRPFNSAPGGTGTATSSSRADGSGRASAWTPTVSTTSRCWAIRSTSAPSGLHWEIASCWGARDAPRFQTLRGSWCSSSALHVLVTSCWPPLAAVTFARRGRFPSTGQATVA